MNAPHNFYNGSFTFGIQFSQNRQKSNSLLPSHFTKETSSSKDKTLADLAEQYPTEPYACRVPVVIQESLFCPTFFVHCSSCEVKQTHNHRPASQVISCFTSFRNILLAAGLSAMAVTTQYAAEHISTAHVKYNQSAHVQ